MTINPLDNSEDYDHIVLSGQVSPGLAVVSGAALKIRWDERQGYALASARLVYHGARPIHFKVTLKLTTTDDWTAWGTWRELLQRPPDGTRARAHDITHPMLSDCGIHSAVVEEVGQPEQTEDSVWEVEITFIEFRPPRPALAVPTGSNTHPITDPLQQQIENESAQNQALARIAEGLP